MKEWLQDISTQVEVGILRVKLHYQNKAVERAQQEYDRVLGLYEKDLEHLASLKLERRKLLLDEEFREDQDLS